MMTPDEDLDTMPTVIRLGVRLEPDGVHMLDRRCFPLTTEVVHCRTPEAVALAIEAMVTQSAGPFFAAGAGLVLAAREAERLPADARREHLQQAAARLRRTRSTNNNIRDVLARLLAVAEPVLASADLSSQIEAEMRRGWSARFARSRLLGSHAASLIEDGDAVLTHCWAEGSLVCTLQAALDAGKRVRVLCTETRPYLQGARLTAHSVAEMGIDTTVITDNMAACAMDRGRVSRLMTAADRVTLSGHVVNKVGTLQLAIAARHFGLPYVAMVQAPDPQAATPADVEMEERDGAESLMCLGHRTASPLARGWYPAFDVTPPALVSAIATCDGVFAPTALRARYQPRAAA